MTKSYGAMSVYLSEVTGRDQDVAVCATYDQRDSYLLNSCAVLVEKLLARLRMSCRVTAKVVVQCLVGNKCTAVLAVDYRDEADPKPICIVFAIRQKLNVHRQLQVSRREILA